jgi:hypothetical protein
MVVISVVVVAPVLWWRLGWQSAALLAIGGLISGTGLFEWLHLMSEVMARMEAGGKPPSRGGSMARILVGFFLRLAVAVALLYGSLKFLHGSVYALLAGLALGVAALTIEGLRLLRSWTT